MEGDVAETDNKVEGGVLAEEGLLDPEELTSDAPDAQGPPDIPQTAGQSPCC